MGRCAEHGPFPTADDDGPIMVKPTHKNKVMLRASSGQPMRQRLYACECRPSNPVWLAHRPRAVSEDRA
jgi:hypothetical protein